MKINPIIYGVVVVSVFLAIVMGFQAAGFWTTSGKISASGEKVTASGDDVESIKGWMTLGDIATAFNVPLEELLNQFQLPADTAATTAVKDLESDTFSTDGLRDWLSTRNTASAGEVAPAATPAASIASTPSPADASTPVVSPTTHTSDTKTISGKTTFQELLDWGVTKETIQKVIGANMPPVSMSIKDYATQNGGEFSTLKDALQAEVDKLQ